jgi:hypothetical protein
MLLGEKETIPDPTYMKAQTEVTENLRAILINKLMSVHQKFRLLDETLFLTVNLVDRYLSQNHIHEEEFLLTITAALLIACKYEEIYPPDGPQLLKHMT